MKTRPLFLALLLCLAVALPGSAAAPASDPAPASNRPNILFIMIDDLAPALGVYGGQAKTPRLDRLAAEGMRFTEAHANAVSCNPSRTSMILGLRPSSTGVTSLGPQHVDWRHYLADPAGPAYQHYGPGIGAIKTLFQHFRDNGYYVATVGKTFHTNDQAAAEPWDQWHPWSFWPGIGWPQNLPLHGLNDYYNHVTPDSDWGAIEAALNPRGGYYTEADLPDFINTRNALAVLDSAPRDRPFFLAVGFLLPHLPWYAPQRMLDLYPLDDIRLPPTIADDLADLPPEAVALVSQGGQYWDQRYVFGDDPQWRKAVAHYLAGVSYVDEQIGRLLDALAAKGLAENTIIVVWGDQGYHLGQKQHLQKHTLWNESTRVPLIIEAPGATRPGSVTHAVVNSVDIFPTLTELAGLAMPTDFHRDGRSLAPLLRDPNAYWPWPATSVLGDWDSPIVTRAAVRTRGWSYLRYDLTDPGPNRSEELYFRIDDPNEWRNLLSPRNGDPRQYESVRSFLETVLQGQMRPDAPPVAQSLQVTAWQGLLQPIRLAGADPNNDYLAFTITALPAHGRLFQSRDGVSPGPEITQPGPLLPPLPGWSVSVLYAPTTAGPDAFQFTVSDGISSSAGTVSVTVNQTALHHVAFPLLH